MTSQVLIIGAGIAGFGLAKALSLHGVPCTMVDRLDGPPPGGMGLNLPGNAVRALAQLGVADEVVERGVRIRRREYRNAAGRLLFSVDEEAFWAEASPSVCLRRGDLLDILRRSTPEMTTRWGTAVVSARPIADGVRVNLRSGASQTHGFVVGSDGVGSVVRSAVTGGADTRRRSRMTDGGWRFIASNPGVDCWTAWSGRDGTFLVIPVDAQQVYGYAAATRGGGGAGPQWLADTFADFAEPVPTIVKAALTGGELHQSPVEEVHCTRWARGRLVIIGDAAHATAPVWAQGAALALEDAIILADLLAANGDWDGTGQQYEHLRRHRIAHVQAVTDRMSRIAALPGWLRDTVAPALGPRAYRAAYGPLR